MMADDLKLDDAFVAWGAAGVDKNFTIFKLYTRKLTDTVTGEVGQFHQDGQTYLPTIELSSDPVGKLKAMVRAYLANAIKSTGVPLENWIVEFSPVMERYCVPSHLFLDTQRDRTWLV